MSNDRGMYSKIYACFWQDEAVQAMSMPTRYMALYLLTCPHKNLIGYYYLPKAYAREDLCMDAEAFEASLGELIASGFCSYNEKSKTVLIPNYLKYNPMDNEKVVISALKVISEIPKSPLDAEFVKVLETYSRPFYGALINEVKKRAEIQYAKPSAIPTDIPSAIPSAIPYGIPYQKPYAEQYAKPVTVTVAVTESLSPARACEEELQPTQNQPGDLDGKAINQALMSLTGNPISPVILEDIRSYQADQGVDEALVLEAISEAKRKGKRTWDYVRGIIRNAIQEGITTGEAFRMRASPAPKHRGRPPRQQTITNGGSNDGNQSAAYSEPGRDWDAEFDAAALARDKVANIAR